MKRTLKTALLVFFVLSSISINETVAQTWRSSLYPANWTPGYKDAQGRFLHDFSYAGYKKGEVPIPEKVGSQYVDVTKPPYNADNTGTNDVTSILQNAITTVGATGGGIVYLPEGTYKVKPGSGAAIKIQNNNVILRGAGIGKTFIYCYAENMRNQQIILVAPASGGTWDSGENGTFYLTQDIPDSPVSTIFLDNVSNLKEGDWVIIRSDRSAAWIAEHQMGGFWSPDPNMGPTFYRKITAVNTTDKSIEIDIPTRYYMKMRDNARVYKVTPKLGNVGLEDFSIGNKMNPATSGWGEEDYNTSTTGAYQVHSAFMIKFSLCIDSWAKNIATYQAGNPSLIHMSSNGMDMDKCRNLTIDNCDFSYAQYKGGGGNGYALNIGSQECLISNGSTTGVRHGYSFKYAYANGNVILGYFSSKNDLASDFHMYLSMSNLIDGQSMNEDFIDATIRPYGANAGNYHGATTTQTVFWNANGIAYKGNSFIIDSRQVGWGYIIGTRGKATGVNTTPTTMSTSYGSVNTAPEDFKEGIGNGSNLEPISLYYDQLGRRLGKDICVPVIASENDVNLAKNAIDGNMETRWAADGPGKWIQFCIGDDPVSVSGVRIAFYNGNIRRSKFDILSSIDGINWTTVATGLQSSGKSSDFESFNFNEPVIARKIRIVGQGNSANTWNVYSEVEFDYSDINAIKPVVLNDRKIVIFPNPFSKNDELTIDLGNETCLTGYLSIADIGGKTILSKEIKIIDNKVKIENLSLSSGVYIISVITDSDKFHEMFVVK